MDDIVKTKILNDVLGESEKNSKKNKKTVSGDALLKDVIRTVSASDKPEETKNNVKENSIKNDLINSDSEKIEIPAHPQKAEKEEITFPDIAESIPIVEEKKDNTNIDVERIMKELEPPVIPDLPPIEKPDLPPVASASIEQEKKAESLPPKEAEISTKPEQKTIENANKIQLSVLPSREKILGKDKPLSAEQLNKLEAIEQRSEKLERENREQYFLIDKQKKEIDELLLRVSSLNNENSTLKKELSNSVNNSKMDVEAQLSKATMLEEKYNLLANRHEELKSKVRRDIRKIRLKEKELVHKMELMKQDSETLLSSKDQKILQLKKQIDGLEFEIETLQDKIETLQDKVKENEEKALRVVKALRLSTSLLETGNKKN